MPSDARSRWIPTPIALGVVAVAAALVSYSTWHVLWTDMYRSLVQGLWLGLAGDMVNGTFYRPLASEIGYGGTRYFPLHFAVIAAVWKLGAAPEWAALVVQVGAITLLATGLFSAVRQMGLTPPLAALAATAAIVPYFIQQSLHELRCDVLATGLNAWGLSWLMRSARTPSPRTLGATLFFTLAFATKITSLAVPLCAVAGLAWSGDTRRALRLLGQVSAGALLVVAAIYVLSAGRALENWQASMFAGVGAEGTLDLLFSGAFIERIGYSRYLRVFVTLTAVALAVTTWTRGAWRAETPLRLIATVFLGVTVATCITLSSPGAMASNQAVEWIAVAVLLVTSAGAAAPWLGRYAGIALSLLALWAAAQNVVQVRQFFGAASTAERPAERAAVIARTRAASGPVFSESALWPVLTERTPIVIDAFMLRVLAEGRPDLVADLSERFDRREFELVILQRNPETPRGREWFEDVTIGWPLMKHILANYRLEGQLAPDAFVYVPR